MADQDMELDDGGRSWLEEQLAAVEAVATTDAAARPEPRDGPDARLVALLELAERRGCSDLHIATGETPRMRHHGRVEVVRDLEPVPAAALAKLLRSALSPRAAAQLDADGSADAVVVLPSGTRVRVNVYRRDSGLAAAFRLLPDHIPGLDELGLPPVVAELADAPRGLLLVTGATGSGKTTTIASLLDRVIGRKPLHVITLEDPIEYRLAPETALMTQRQVGDHVTDFPGALRQAMRQDPDVIVIGEMRDPETIAAALTAAETGHLVLATLHSRTAESAVSRIVESFGEGRQGFVRSQLATALVGVVSQQLVPGEQGGRVLAVEVLVATTAVTNLIRESKLHQIGAAVDTGAAQGMQSMDRSLATLVRRREISLETAVARCVDPTGLRELLR